MRSDKWVVPVQVQPCIQGKQFKLSYKGNEKVLACMARAGDMTDVQIKYITLLHQ